MRLLTIAGLFVGATALDVNLGILLSLTGLNDDTRVLLPSFLGTVSMLFEGVSQINDNLPSVPFELSGEQGTEYRCNNITLNPIFIDTMAEFGPALTNLAAARAATPLHAIIGARRSSVSIPVSYVTSTARIPIISPASTSPRLSDLSAHRYFSRVVTSDTSTASVYLQFLRDNNLNRAVMLYIEDEFGTGYKDAIFTEAENDDSLEIEFVSYAPERESILAAVDRVAETRLNVVLAIAFDVDVPDMMLAANARNLTGPGRFWVFGDGIRSGEDVISIVNQRTELTLAEREEIFASFNESFLLAQTAEVSTTEPLIEALNARHRERIEDVEFFQDLILNLPGGSNYLESEAELDNPFDNSDFTIGVMGELSDVSYFAYDSLLLIRKVLDDIFFVGEGLDCSEDIDLFSGVTFRERQGAPDFSFSGVTGEMRFEGNSRSIDSTSVSLSKFMFHMENDVYVPTQPRQALFQSGAWDIGNLVFKGNVLPAITDPPLTVNENVVSSNLVFGMRFFASILLCIIAGIALWLIGYSYLPILAAAQPGYLLSALSGTFVLCCAVFFLDLDQGGYSRAENDLRCRLPYSLISAGLTLIYASLIFKLRNIISAKEAKEEDGAEKKPHLFNFTFVILLNAIFLLIMNLEAPLVFDQSTLETDEFDQVIESYGRCIIEDDSRLPVYYMLFAYHIILYFYGFYMVLQARNLPDDFQDGFSVSISIFAQVQLSLLAIPVIVSIGPEETQVFYMILCLIICLFTCVLLGVLFLPKIMRVWSGNVDAVWASVGVDLDDLQASDENLSPNAAESRASSVKTDHF